jgi:CarD family transcriptional regulator
MYEVGDYVICRSGGIWCVEGADAGKIRLARYESEDMQELSADEIEIVRKIVSKEKILEVIDRVGFIRTIQAPNDKIRNEFYQEAMMKYDEIEWIKVIKTVYLRQKEKRVAATEQAYADKARAFLYGEISLLLEIPIGKVEDYISAAVSKDTW